MAEEIVMMALMSDSLVVSIDLFTEQDSLGT